MGGEDRVVGLDDGRRERRSRVDRELELRLLAVVSRELLEEESTETGTRSSTERVEDEESLKTLTVVGELADTVAGGVDQLLSDGVVTTRVVVRGVLLSVDEGFGVEELTVFTGANFIDDGRFQIDVDRTGDVFARSSLGEESRESSLRVLLLGVFVDDATVGSETVFEAVEFPTAVESES